MSYLFHTQVVVLYGSIVPIDYVRFVSYCSMWFHRVNRLCYICIKQKCMVVLCSSIKSIDYMLYLFHAEVDALYVSTKSVDYVRFVSYSDCPVHFHRVNRLCCSCFIQKCLIQM